MRRLTVSALVLALAPAAAHAQSAEVYCSPFDLSSCFSVRLGTGTQAVTNALSGSLFVRNLEGSYAHGAYGGHTGRTAINTALVSHYNDPALGFGLDGLYPTFRTVGTVRVAPPSQRGDLFAVDLSLNLPVPGTTLGQGWVRELGDVLLGCTAPDPNASPYVVGLYSYSTCPRDGFGGELGFDFVARRYLYPLPSQYDPGTPSAATFDDFAVEVGDCYATVGATSGVNPTSSIPACVATGDYLTADGALVSAPEPATLGLTLGGLAVFGVGAWRRRRTA